MSSIRDIAQLLARHPVVSHVEAPREDTDSGKIVMEITINVSLPSRARPAGVTSAGVRNQEVCRLEFRSTWPSTAPDIGLRKDFPRNLPHINPHRAGDYVRPCIYAGSTSELMHREGFLSVIDQLVDWLNNAAAGTLMNEGQGWEPTRRDENYGRIYFDPEEMVRQIEGADVPARFQAGFSCRKGVYSVLCQMGEMLPVKSIDLSCREWKDPVLGDLLLGRTCVSVFFPEKLNHEIPVNHDYVPDTVSDFNSLLSMAASLGISSDVVNKEVNRLVAGHARRTGSGSWHHGVRVVVVLVVRRPFPLIGSECQENEFLPYVIDHQPLPGARSISNALVAPILPVSPVSPRLLMSTSGATEKYQESGHVWFGVGSLGSKVATHFLRSGLDNHIFVDNDIFEPHNVARHACMDLPELMRVPIKAHAMAVQAVSFGLQKVGLETKDIVDLLNNEDAYRKAVPQRALVVDSTASYSVSDAVMRSPCIANGENRYCRLSLLAGGKGGVLMLEGDGRSPRIDDIMASFYTACFANEDIGKLLSQARKASPEVFYGGQNCASVTTIMSDSLVSLHASKMALQLERWAADGLPASGYIKLHIQDDDPFKATFYSSEIEPTHVFSADGWEVRILGEVEKEIERVVKKAGRNETGGLLMGHVDLPGRCITISMACEPSPDSKSSPTSFTLGASGLLDLVNDVERRSFGYIRMLGTWHSHPEGGGPSRTDIETLEGLAKDAAGFPVVSLIWKPEGYSCRVMI